MTEFYTTSEVAALLRVRPRKIYDMVSEGALPVRKVTGKLLFPRREIEDWLGSRAAPAEDQAAERRAENVAEPPLIAAGGHDPLLEWALRESQSGIAGFFDGAMDGLARAERGGCAFAGLHIPEDDGWNTGAVAAKFAQAPWVTIEWAQRRRGLIMRRGLTTRPETLKATRGLRFQARQALAGSELVLDRLLAAEGMTRADLHIVNTIERSEFDLAGAIAQGRADVGLGLEAGARQFNLDFAPMVEERFDLLVWRKAFFDPPFQKLAALCASAKFAEKAREFGGYDVSNHGAVHFNGAR
ncbi:helix-turn-helix transcriptional regulator [Rhodoblastus acidophilus]|uniref:Helix-turn-helix transcriptional regulator n=1 Tax=Candidatus Rhodoblastus alkanivorans TaxID=2954117 RepID=A0ABS9Z718_9HYPH|nr:helix-turn-helix transcriptional regulator [Candidatus Rhodoblastus alkanivorans]MCI4679229.1 helix-turn-helix transcriptional regulator [Candidatus Rhodoblastus alkanivorans]MCI4682447.1 helix-turn-helix transcriptional regulator [Candidatus Rhodoblastus alkanivorans]MDI4639753.1 helix-turn-helix transcriptional regulator [Rhodoblastus acidophilus]